MGSSSSVTPALPPLPAGATLMNTPAAPSSSVSTSGLPPLPAGATLTGSPAATAAPVPAAAPSGPDTISANPKNEGTYKMLPASAIAKPRGLSDLITHQTPQPISVPYSKVDALRWGGGYSFADVDEADRYKKDNQADRNPATHATALDPNNPSLSESWRAIKAIPHQMRKDLLSGTTGNPVVGVMKGGEKTVGGLLNILADNRQQALEDEAKYQQKFLATREGKKVLAAGGKPSPSPSPVDDPVIKYTRKAADWLNSNTEDNGFWEHAGDFGENIAELMSPEALGSLAKTAEAVKTGEAVTAGEKFADASKMAKLLKQYPRLASLVGIGLSAAAKGAAEVGGQTYVKTGGDTDAATQAAELGAAGGAIIAPLGEAAAGAVRNMAPEMRMIDGVEVPVPRDTTPPLTPAQRASSEAYTAAARGTVAPHLQNIGMAPEQIDKYLNTFHDFTGAGDKLTQANDAVYDHLDDVTGKKFRKLNDEVAQAQKNAWDGGPNAEKHYKNKQAEMEDLLNKSGLDSEYLQKAKASWRQSYILNDAGNTLDKSLDGLPGQSNVSMEQRGINGKKLQSGLQQLVRQYGYDTVDQAMGPGRLKNLELIAKANTTNSGRALFNRGIKYIVPYLGLKAGEAATGHFLGGLAGAGMAESALVGTQRVMNAIRTNPKIGQNLIFALESGARPQNYGPLIGSMITQAESQQQEPNQ